MHAYRTVLEEKIKERRQTLTEFVDYAEVFAREHRQPGTLSVRHLQRLIAGHGAKGEPLGSLRPATARLLESIFDSSIDELLSAPNAMKSAAIKKAESGNRAHRTIMLLSPYYEWLDEHAGWMPGTSRKLADAQIAKTSTTELVDQCARRARVKRNDLERSLSAYYGDHVAGYGSYRARCGGEEATTTILTRPDWLDLACPLTQGTDRLTLVRPSAVRGISHGEARLAVERLVEAATLDVRLSNAPLYRLTSIDARKGAISGTVCLAPFTEYALTMDLLECETIDAMAAKEPISRGHLPLRDRYLPDLPAVLNISHRLCAGGVPALCAIARPCDPYRGEPDYVLLIQQRSSRVLNATQKLAVIPKGFHEPLTDPRSDTQIGTTLRREMEEELFGRLEVDSTLGERRAASPMHPSRLSEPMRWLMSGSDRLRMECTGFGLNLVSGNYEFASVIVIEDDEFWTRRRRPPTPAGPAAAPGPHRGAGHRTGRVDVGTPHRAEPGRRSGSRRAAGQCRQGPRWTVCLGAERPLSAPEPPGRSGSPTGPTSGAHTTGLAWRVHPSPSAAPRGSSPGHR